MEDQSTAMASPIRTPVANTSASGRAVAPRGDGIGLELGDPSSALREGEAAGLDAAAQAGQAADVAN